MKNKDLNKKLVEYRKKVELARAKAKKESELNALKKEYQGYRYGKLKKVGKGFWVGARKIMDETGRTFSNQKPPIKKVVAKRRVVRRKRMKKKR